MNKAVIFLIFPLILSSCGQRNEDKILNAISENMENREFIMEFKEEKFEGSITKSESGIFLTFSSENLPVKIEEFKKGEEMIFSSGDFKLEKDAGSSPLKLITEAFEKLKYGEIHKSPNMTRLIKEPFEAVFTKEGDLEEILFPFGKLKFLCHKKSS